MTINMKKSSPFVNIPTIPTTFSGQWLTFSHMANHYRKLINVKPRVDSNAPRNSFTNVILAKSPSKPLKTSKNARTNQNTTARKGRPDSSENHNNVPTATSTTKTKKNWTTRPKMASRMLDYEYHALSKGLMNSPNGSFKGSSSDGYQVVFGPSSIKSSVDAIVSDPEIIRDPEPQLSSISIGEKIRKFLDHIHAQESQHKFSNGHGTRPLSGNSIRERRDPSKSKEQLVENHHNRHSKCFTPFEVQPKGTKKRIVKPSRQRSQRFIDSPILSSKESRRSLSTAPAALRARERTNIDSPKTMMNTSISSSRKTYTLQQNSQSINNSHNFEGLISSFSSSNNKKGTKVLKRKTEDSPNISPRSGSVGTIHGSDELETEEFLLPSPTLPRNLSTIQIDSEDLPQSWLKDKVERGVVRINNAYFQLRESSNSSVGIQHNPDNDNEPEKDSSSLHQHHRPHQYNKNNQLYHNHHLNGQTTIHHPNKDSSRDSAYGFSSGESMTTRESTPEKKSPHSHHHHHHHHHHQEHHHSPPSASVGKSSTKPVIKGSLDVNGKYKSSLSTVASSINQDDSSHNNTGDSSGHSSSCSEKSIFHPFSSPLSSTSPNKSSNDLLSDEKYINFLTVVTDDIVSRGIYTNKGIKSALKTHLMKRSDLDMDKMLCLLERLRMDIGCPKDDSLNTLEFGYGCVEYSSGPFFYKDKGPIQPTSLPINSNSEGKIRNGAQTIHTPPDDVNNNKSNSTSTNLNNNSENQKDTNL